MWMLRLFSVTVIAFLFFGQMEAKPYQVVSRQKRTSDQRLAELETLIALSKMNGKLVTIPIGFGKIDPNKIFTVDEEIHRHARKHLERALGSQLWKAPEPHFSTLSNVQMKEILRPNNYGRAGRFPSAFIGRRRRSLSLLLQQLINDVSTEDKRSDESAQNVECGEEDGGEEKEEKVNRNDKTGLLSEMLPLKTTRHIPVTLLQ